MDNVSDEVLMAFADGALSETEHARVAARVAADPGLEARLQPFAVTRTALPALFAEATSGPLPERLLKTVREAPMASVREAPMASVREAHMASVREAHMASAAKPSAAQSLTGFLSRAAQAVSDALFPSGFGLVQAFALTALMAGAGAAGWLAANSNRPGAAPGTGDIAFNDGIMYATGTLAHALETAPSAPSDATAASGSIAPTLTFVANDHRFCRQYEMTLDTAKRFGGFACRDAKGAWQVVFHSELTGGRPGGGNAGYETAAGPGSPALEAAIDKFGDGGRIERDEETALLAKGWK